MEDYHLHTELSMDSTETLKNYCEAAIKKGICEIAVTEHFDDEVVGVAEANLFDPKRHADNVNHARAAFLGKLTIRMGIELGQPHYNPDVSREVLNKNEYDFVIASFHYHQQDGDYFKLDYSKLNFDKIYDSYLSHSINMLEFTDFDILGHITYPVRYAYANTACFDVLGHEKKLKELFLKLIKMDKGIEVNTSMFRRGKGEPVLDKRLYSLYYSLGGRIVTIGSDAHCADHLGVGIPEALLSLKEIGFSQVATYEKRKRIMRKI